MLKNLLEKNVAVQVKVNGLEDHSLASLPLVAMELITLPTWLLRHHHHHHPHLNVATACRVDQVHRLSWPVGPDTQTMPCNGTVVPPLPQDPAQPRSLATFYRCWVDRKLIARVEASLA